MKKNPCVVSVGVMHSLWELALELTPFSAIFIATEIFIAVLFKIKQQQLV